MACCPPANWNRAKTTKQKADTLLKHDGLIAKLVGKIDLHRPGGSVNRRYLLLIVEDRLRNRFAHFKLGAHFLDLRGLIFFKTAVISRRSARRRGVWL